MSMFYADGADEVARFIMTSTSSATGIPISSLTKMTGTWQRGSPTRVCGGSLTETSGACPMKSIWLVSQNGSRRSCLEIRSLVTINLQVLVHTNCIKDVRSPSESDVSSWQLMRHICATHCKHPQSIGLEVVD